MKGISPEEECREQFLEMCPEVVSRMRSMITDPSTPVSAKVTLIGMILERALGKPETPVKVTTVQENMEDAEAELLAMIEEMQAKKE